MSGIDAFKPPHLWGFISPLEGTRSRLSGGCWAQHEEPQLPGTSGSNPACSVRRAAGAGLICMQGSGAPAAPAKGKLRFSGRRCQEAGGRVRGLVACLRRDLPYLRRDAGPGAEKPLQNNLHQAEETLGGDLFGAGKSRLCAGRSGKRRRREGGEWPVSEAGEREAPGAF